MTGPGTSSGTGTEQAPAAGRWELLLPHQDRLRRLAWLRLSSHQDVEDCVQEALLRAALHRDLDEDRVGPFLTSVLLRLCVDVHRYRERSRRHLHQHRFHVEPVQSPEETVCAAAEGAWMLQQVRRLAGRERDIVLARIEGTSTREAAGRLGISVKAAEGAFTRARARLRRWHSAGLEG
ncbi:RNA polymerase sigma factor [Streptomyces mutabilis]|uniref:RNA polymerase sigma factor n=1 Tax=Streptomyces mutabilis TaxID=67332 RepID=UPI0005BC67F8|nr:sigma-70 family RNA polymerase sigma factor [Streptomyces mutabilis]GGQ48949.1 DNA-directed RNA polymerase sigma-70 factor [Streptomyces mutabilis]